MKFFLPIILIAIAVGALFALVLPKYDEVRGLRAKQQHLVEALKNAEDSERLFSEVEIKYNTISEEDRNKLESILPSKKDAVRLVIYLNSVARESGVNLTDIRVPNDQPAAAATAEGVVEQYQPIDVSFKFNGSYGQMISFLSALEQSLRVLDVADLSFTVPEKGLPDYTITVRTYWKT